MTTSGNPASLFKKLCPVHPNSVRMNGSEPALAQKKVEVEDDESDSEDSVGIEEYEESDDEEVEENEETFVELQGALRKLTEAMSKILVDKNDDDSDSDESEEEEDEDDEDDSDDD